MALGILCSLFAKNCDALTSLAPVTVTASPIDEDEDRSPGTVTVIRADLYKGELKTLPELLSRAAGVTVTRAGGRGGRAMASVRGSAAAQVMVYVDGVLWNLGGNWAVDLSSIPLDRVDRVEIYRGYVPAAFDLSGMGAVINVVTVKPREGEVTLTAGAGDMGLYSGALRYAAAAGGGSLSLFMESRSEKGGFSYGNDNGSLNPFDDYAAKRQNNGFWEEGAELRYAGEGLTLSAGLIRRHRELPLPAPGNDKEEEKNGPWQDLERRSFSVGKTCSSRGMDWSWSLNRTEEDRDFRDPLDRLGSFGVKRSVYDTVRDGLSLSGTAVMGEHFLEFTLKGGQEELNVKGDGVTVLGGLDRFRRKSCAAVLQDAFPAGDAVLTPLVRWNEVDGESGLSWALGAEWSWDPGWRLKGTLGLSRRAPDFYEVYGDGATILPGLNLKWEEGFHWDIGLRHRGPVSGGDGSFGATLFGMDMDELIEYVQVNERIGSYKNIGKAVIRGLELEADLKWEKLALNLSWTLMDGENRTWGYRYGKALPNRPESVLDIRLTGIMSPVLSAFAEFQSRGTAFLDMAEQIGLSDLARWNLGVRWSNGPDRTLTAGIGDIFDRGSQVRQFASGKAGGERLPWYPMEGRTWYLSYQRRL